MTDRNWCLGLSTLAQFVSKCVRVCVRACVRTRVGVNELYCILIIFIMSTNAL